MSALGMAYTHQSYLNEAPLFGGASPFLSGVIVRLLLFVLQFTQTDAVITQ